MSGQHDPALVEAFALAVAWPGSDALLLDSGNLGVSRTAIPDAAQSGSAFAVPLRDGVIALDLDGTQAAECAVAAVQELRSRGCHIVRVTSGGGEGREHVWVLGPVGWTTAALRQVALDAGVKRNDIRWNDQPDGRRARPPLSVHRTGAVPRLMEPQDAREALRLLSQRPGRVELSVSMVRLTAEGDTAGRYKTATGTPSRDAAAQGLALAYVNADKTEMEFIADIFNPVNAAGEKLRFAKDRVAGAQRLWLRACEYARDHPPVRARDINGPRLEALSTAAGSYPWSGRSGMTDRRVYAHLLDLGHQLGSLRVSSSHRAISDACGIADSTVPRSLDRLKEAGLIRCLDPGVGFQAATYELCESTVNECNNPSSTTRGTEEVIAPTNPRFASPPDAFQARGGLPATSWETWLNVPPGVWLSTRQVAGLRGGGLRIETVREHLNKLHSAGLYERDGRKWMKLDADEAQLSLLATAYGTAGAADRRRQRHDYHREAALQRGYVEHRNRKRTESAQSITDDGEVLVPAA